MCSQIVCIAAVLLGIDAGWQPLPDGGMEYLIQIEPHLLETLKSGEPIRSDIPPYVKDIRTYRITVGMDELPRDLPPPEADRSETVTTTINKPPTAPNLIEPDPASKPVEAQQANYLEPTATSPKPEAKSPSDQDLQQEEPQDEEPAKPWMPLTVTLFTLFGSLGANLYLGWITWNTRSRYRTLLNGANDPALKWLADQRDAADT